MSALKTAIKKRHTVNLFFTELIIALLFFSISGAVIFRVFVSADKKTRESMKKENAIICAQSIAEVYSETADIDKTFDIVFSDSGVQKSDTERGITLDKYCKPAADGEISLTVSELREDKASGTLSRLTLVFTSGDEEIYSLECSAYKPVGGADDE